MGGREYLPPSPPVLLLQGVDLLEVAFVADVQPSLLAQLANHRRDGVRTVNVGGRDWTLAKARLQRGKQFFSFQLEDARFATVGITHAKPGVGFPTVVVRFACRRLWECDDQRGVEAAFSAWREARAWVSRFAVVRRAWIDRIQSTADFDGWSLTERDGDLLVGHGRRGGIATWKDRAGRLTGFHTKEDAALSVHLYAKAIEIREKSPEKEFFFELWGPNKETLRVEASFKRAALERHIESADPDHVLARLGDLWRLAFGTPGTAEGWLRHVDGTSGDSNPSRRPTSALWEAVRAVAWPAPSARGTPAEVTAAPPRAGDLKGAVASVQGSLAWLGAVAETHDPATSLGHVLTSDYLARFRELVESKARAKGHETRTISAFTAAVGESRSSVEYATSAPIPRELWGVLVRELRATAALLTVRGDPLPWTTAGRTLLREAERSVPLRSYRDSEGEERIGRDPLSEDAWDRWRALWVMALAVCYTDSDPRDAWSIFASADLDVGGRDYS